MKRHNWIVLVWGYISLLGVAGFLIWLGINYWQIAARIEFIPSYVGIDDLAKNPDFKSYTASVARVSASGKNFSEKTLIASYFFKNKFSKRRTEEWKEINNFINENKGRLSEEDITSLLGAPDSIEETKRHLRYDLVNFGGGGMGVEIDIAAGKVVESHEMSWIH